MTKAIIEKAVIFKDFMQLKAKGPSVSIKDLPNLYTKKNTIESKRNLKEKHKPNLARMLIGTFASYKVPSIRIFESLNEMLRSSLSDKFRLSL